MYKRQDELKTFVVNNTKKDEIDTKLKKFEINFEDLDNDEESDENPVQEMYEDSKKSDDLQEKMNFKHKSFNPFTQINNQIDTLTPTKNKLNFSSNSKDSENLYEIINQTNKFKMSVTSSSSGYSKENLILDMTPDKPKTSSIDMRNSSEKKIILSDFKNKKLNVMNLDFSVNSRPSFLDRKPNHMGRLYKEERNWDNLSVNTNEMINFEEVSEISDNEKQSILDEILDLDIDHEDKVLFGELIRNKSQKEANDMLIILKKMPWIFKETLEKKKDKLLKQKKDRKERRIRNKGKKINWQNNIRKGK